jgi:hypothetical protein
MEILDNGDYKLVNGTIISRDAISQLHTKMEAPKPVKIEGKEELQEGQCSGKLQLED